MNAMADALKKKRMGLVDLNPPEGHMDSGGDEGQGGKDLLGLVASLSEEERGKLKDILSAAGSNDIQKGEPSSGEQQKIKDQISLDQQKEEASEGTGDEPGDSEAAEGDVSAQSDDIGKSMLDSKYRQGPIAGKPRNLGERVKNNIAANLKSKGKL